MNRRQNVMDDQGKTLSVGNIIQQRSGRLPIDDNGIQIRSLIAERQKHFHQETFEDDDEDASMSLNFGELVGTRRHIFMS